MPEIVQVPSVCVAIRTDLRLEAAVHYSVHFAADLDVLPKDVRKELEHTMGQIAEAIDTLPPASPFFSSMSDSVLQIDVLGWRVVYQVNPRQHLVLVLELEMIPP